MVWWGSYRVCEMGAVEGMEKHSELLVWKAARKMQPISAVITRGPSGLDP